MKKAYDNFQKLFSAYYHKFSNIAYKNSLKLINHDHKLTRYNEEKKYHVEEMNERSNMIFVEGVNIVLNPFSENQIEFEKPSLLASIQ